MRALPLLVAACGASTTPEFVERPTRLPTDLRRLGTASEPEPPPASPADEAADQQFLKDISETKTFRLGDPLGPQLLPDGSQVLFLRAQPRKNELRLYALDVASGQTRELVTPEQVLQGAAEKLSPEEKARRERMRIGSTTGFTRYQLSADGTFNGLFTAKLLRVWNGGKFRGNYADFHASIVELMPPVQTPNHVLVGPAAPAFDAQKPFQI